MFPSVDEQLAAIRRGVAKIVPEEELVEKLKQSRKTGTPLRVKYGIDPTGVDLHLGHTVPMRKLRQFQELGHQAVIIIGNYTALVGDPSGQDETRPRMTVEQVDKNAADYLEQVGKVLDLEQAEVVRNGDWFAAMSFADVLDLCSKVTVAQLLTRDDFAKRSREEKAIYLHECLYPVMQAWDSVMVRADVELGGTEQLYSFMLARDLQRDQGQPGQVGIMSPILVGTDGVRRMGKSLGNYIGISEPPYEMMKKIMGLPDAKEQEDGTVLPVMRQYFELLTDVPLDEADRMIAEDPKGAKLTLAKTIIAQYATKTVGVGQATETDIALPVTRQKSPPVGQATETNSAGAVTPKQIANAAAKRWQKEIAGGELPEEIHEIDVRETLGLSDQVHVEVWRPAVELLYSAGLTKSKSEARRLIAQGGAYYGEEKIRIESPDEKIKLTPGLLLWAGKKKVVRVQSSD